MEPRSTRLFGGTNVSDTNRVSGPIQARGGRRWIVRVVLIVILGLASAATAMLRRYAASAGEGTGVPGLDHIRAAADRVKSLYSPKTKPKPGEWLDKHPEMGQTFDEYVVSGPNRPNAKRTTIYIQPIGEFTKSQQRVVDETADFMARFFGTPVRSLDRLGLDRIPESARRVHSSWGDKQILTTYVLHDVLEPRRPDDGVAVLALTASDLWPGEGWNFVFGQASLRDRVGVWSLYRNGDPDEGDAAYRLFLERTIKTATHETGHMLGIWHCTAYECGMNGSNHRTESDSRPLEFCYECVQKVWWACNADPTERCASLLEFADRHKLVDARDFWKRSLARLKEPR
jgi:archaemetzincin